MSQAREQPTKACTAPTPDSVEAALRTALAMEDAPVVVSAYLFGSVAEGRAHRESDVDVGVLLDWSTHPDRAERFDVGLRLAGALQAVLGRTLDVVVLNDAPPLLGRHVVTHGRRLLCRDAAADHLHVRDVQLRAADLEPWLRRLRPIQLAALRR